MRALRIRTRDGELRICTMGGHADLQSFWFEARAAGFIVGNAWAMPVDNIAIIDVIDVADEEPEPMTGQQGNEQAHEHLAAINRMALGIAAGWKPPHE